MAVIDDPSNLSTEAWDKLHSSQGEPIRCEDHILFADGSWREVDPFIGVRHDAGWRSPIAAIAQMEDMGQRERICRYWELRYQDCLKKFTNLRTNTAASAFSMSKEGVCDVNATRLEQIKADLLALRDKTRQIHKIWKDVEKQLFPERFQPIVDDIPRVSGDEILAVVTGIRV